MPREIIILIIFLLLFLIDLYVYQAVRVAFKKTKTVWKKSIQFFYWLMAIAALLSVVLFRYGTPGPALRNLLLSIFFLNYFSKIFGVIILFIDDIRRFVKWIFSKAFSSKPSSGKGISRSDFLAKSAIAAIAIPAGGMGYGIISGAYNYKIRRETLYLNKLPSSFDGIQIAQLSDIHSGSLLNRTAVKGGIEMLMKEKPDIIFFTGDLVNSETKEVNDFISIFDKVKAPLGVFSVLGNHDYGDYKKWPSNKAKTKNFEDMILAHKALGWNLLMNENRTIEQNGDKIAILGVENWGTGRFPKYGKLKQAYEGIENIPVKLLLSHDPSHWDAEIRPLFHDIDVTFSGHTHGFQLGIEIGSYRWSPSQYIYKQWAGLYQSNEQQIYVNRGFGFVGFPGRVGIMPEITIFELKKA